jgi:hypothetical protein
LRVTAVKSIIFYLTLQVVLLSSDGWRALFIYLALQVVLYSSDGGQAVPFTQHHQRRRRVLPEGCKMATLAALSTTALMVPCAHHSRPDTGIPPSATPDHSSIYFLPTLALYSRQAHAQCRRSAAASLFSVFVSVSVYSASSAVTWRTFAGQAGREVQ